MSKYTVLYCLLVSVGLGVTSWIEGSGGIDGVPI